MHSCYLSSPMSRWLSGDVATMTLGAIEAEISIHPEHADVRPILVTDVASDSPTCARPSAGSRASRASPARLRLGADPDVELFVVTDWDEGFALPPAAEALADVPRRAASTPSSALHSVRSGVLQQTSMPRLRARSALRRRPVRAPSSKRLSRPPPAAKTTATTSRPRPKISEGRGCPGSPQKHLRRASKPNIAVLTQDAFAGLLRHTPDREGWLRRRGAHRQRSRERSRRAARRATHPSATSVASSRAIKRSVPPPWPRSTRRTKRRPSRKRRGTISRTPRGEICTG